MPAADQKQYQFIDIADFSHGIYDEWYAAAGPQAAPDGSAQLAGTYSCCSSNSGALIPAPKLVRQYTETQFDTDLQNYPSQDQLTHITAFRNVSSVNQFPNAATSSVQTFYPNADAAVGAGWQTQSGGTTNLFASIATHPVNVSNFIHLTTNTVTNYEANLGTSGWVSNGRTIQYVQFVLTTDGGVDTDWFATGHVYGAGSVQLIVAGTTIMAPDFTKSVVGGNTVETITLFKNPVTGVAWTDTDITNFNSGTSYCVNFAGGGQASGKFYQLAMIVFASAVPISGFTDQAFYAFQWYKNSPVGSGVYVQKTKVRTYKYYQAATGTVTALDLDTVTTGNGVVPPQQTPFYGYTDITLTRVNTANPTLPGIAIVPYIVNPWLDNSVFIAHLYNSSGTDATANVAITNNAAVKLVAHQDRTVSINWGTFPPTGTILQNFGNGGSIGFEVIRATNVNDSSTDSGINSIFVNESPSNVGCLISANAQELFFIKSAGGAFLARGDLASPTIVRLPGLPSADIAAKAVPIPGGMIYGSSTGIWEFTGGNTATCISTQLDGKFWVPPQTQNYLGDVGSFGLFWPFVWVPNAFLYDLRKKGWWKLKRTSAPTDTSYAWFEASPESLMIVAPPYFQSGQSIADWYDIHQGQSYYQWISQPLARSRGRVLTFREVNLVASGNGTITLTLDSFMNEEPIFTETQLINSSQPVTVNIPTECEGGDVQLIITSTAAGLSPPSGVTIANPNAGLASTSAVGPAPSVYRVQLAYEETRTIRATPAGA